ncbi:putative ribonuclease H-like domain-containing protein [Tanacetum coccineum]
MEFENSHNNALAKLPMLKLREYEMWEIRIKQYFQIQDYALWEVIENGNSWVPIPVTTTETGPSTGLKMTVPSTAEEKTAKKNDVKARTRFGGNKATRKTQKALLKQQYENFNASSSESLDSIFNRLQKLVSRLAILGVVTPPEDLNVKFLRSLPSEWDTHVVVWMNKPDFDTMGLDDLYNNFKIVEQKVKKSVGTNNDDKNLAFLTTSGASSTNTANPEVSTGNTKVNTASTEISTASFSDATVYAFLSTQPQGSQLVHEDLEQLHDDDLEEMDLKWNMALLSMRARKFYQRTGRKIIIDGSSTAGYDKSKVECFNCHKMGHFARECRAPRSKDNRNWNQGSSSKAVRIEDASEKAMCAIDGAGFDWSDMAEEEIQANMALMAFSDSEVTNDKSCSKSCLQNYEALKKQYDDLLVKLDDTGFKASTYKRGLSILEGQILKYKESEVLFSEEIALLKRSVGHKEEYLKDYLGLNLKRLRKKMRGFKFKIAKFEKSSKDLDQLLAKSDNSKENTDDSLKQQQKTDSSSVKSPLKVYVTFGGGAMGGDYCIEMCDKKNYVLFTDSECLVLSPNFKLPDANQILLKIPRQDNMYSFDMKNIVPKDSLTCLVAKATSEESMLWHRRLGHINFKNINKLVKENLVFFLTTKDETSEILKNFIKEVENLVDKKVKIIRSDNGTEFKNKVMDDFCREKGIKREYSVARTPQQNGVAERKNRTLIEAARTMLADSKLPTTFWAEAVSTACYVQNRVLIVKPHNKTPYELFRVVAGKSSNHFVGRRRDGMGRWNGSRPASVEIGVRAQRSAKATTDDNGEVQITATIDDDEDIVDDSSKQGRKLSDAEVQEKASTKTEPFIQEVTPTEVIQDQENSKKGSAEVSTAGAIKEKRTRQDKGKAIMLEYEPKKKSKKEIEQERLSFAEAIRLEEQMNEEQRAQIARDEEIARQWDEEERQRAMSEAKTSKKIDWNDPPVIRYHAPRSKPKTVVPSKENMIIYLKNQGTTRIRLQENECNRFGSRVNNARCVTSIKATAATQVPPTVAMIGSEKVAFELKIGWPSTDLTCRKRISDKRTKNKAKNDKTEHGMEKHESQSQSQSQQKSKSKSTP